MTNKKSAHFPLNQILFGPPGTGKTFNTVNKALEIAGENLEGKTRDEIKKLFDEKVNDGQIVFTTFHQSMSYEDFVEGIKPLKPLTNDTFVKYDVLPGIFKKICDKAKSNYENSKAENKGKIEFEEAFELFKQEWEENPDMKFPLRTQGNDYTIIGFTDTSIQFKKASGGTNHSLSINTLKEIYYGKVINTREDVGIYYPSVLKKIQSYETTKPVMVTLKSFVLIIDEINRGNVSQIFGELITLIEEDKRQGNAEALEVVLPYSKEKFSVPPNLYILGTMNTADRSVEAIDTALRRRFSFEEISPRYDLEELKYEFAGFSGHEILQTLNARIEKLLDKDHQIGHSYFMLKNGEKAEEKLITSFYKNIIPLLQEYFYGDFGKIGLVLGKGFVRKKEWQTGIDSFADFDYVSASDFDDKEIFEIIDYRLPDLNYSIKIGGSKTVLDFQKAIKLLMKQGVE